MPHEFDFELARTERAIRATGRHHRDLRMGVTVFVDLLLLVSLKCGCSIGRYTGHEIPYSA